MNITVLILGGGLQALSTACSLKREGYYTAGDTRVRRFPEKSNLLRADSIAVQFSPGMRYSVGQRGGYR